MLSLQSICVREKFGKKLCRKHWNMILPWLRRHQWGFLQEEEGDIIRHDGQHVDDVHPIDQEVNLVVDVSLVIMTGSMMKKYTLLGLPANLRRYSRVNQDMQTDSINASFGLSKGFPVEYLCSRPYFHGKKQLTSEVGVLEGVHSVQAHPHCWDHHEHHAGQKLLPVCKKLIQPDVRHPFCCRRGVRLFDQVPKVFLMPGPPSQV